MRLALILVSLFLHLMAHSQIEGVILDEERNPLPNAILLLMPDSTYTQTDDAGRFKFKKLSQEAYEIRAFYVGYKDKSRTVLLKNGKARGLRIVLKPNVELLETIVISDEHAKQEESLRTEHIHESFIEKNLEGTFAQSIEKLAGISAINVGVGIAKPVIRGLSSNRIIVNHQGIKQESQQWGSDHGLEIDQFDVERIEIIKGPGSLQYGSDGLGGVINIMPDKILAKQSYAGSIVGLHKTNNQHWGGSAKLGVNFDNLFLTMRYSYQDFADYKVPTDVFTYNGFDLSIFNNRLKNTAGNEANLSLNLGLVKNWGVTRLHYSHYDLNAGIFSGAVGIPRSYALNHDGNYRDIDVPQQQVDHYRLSLNQTLIFGHNHITIDMGYQQNIRKELSQPEFHSIPLSQLKDPNDKTAIALKLETYSIATHYEHEIETDWKGILGANGQWQNNTRAGFEYLIPDFHTSRGGIYYISEKNISKDLLLNGGLRLDLGKNVSPYTRQFVWDSNENIVDSLTSEATNDLFFNWSASLGSNWNLQDGKWTLKANLGKSFRVPYPAETVSNGIHHGTFRHEVGTADLDSEHGYQLDLGSYWKLDYIQGSLSVYFNYFDNYIYLGPTFPAQFSKLPEAGQVYQYRQDDAIYTGFELEWDWSILSNLKLSQTADFVQSFNPKTKLALPFTPQPSIRTSLNLIPYNTNWFKNPYITLEHQFHAAASGRWRIDRSEKPTPAYQLWDMGIGSEFHFGTSNEIQLKFQVKNIFNTKYLSHLSRYKIINIPEQGRNLVLSAKVLFGGSLQRK